MTPDGAGEKEGLAWPVFVLAFVLSGWLAFVVPAQTLRCEFKIQPLSADEDATKVLIDILRHAGGQFDQTVVVPDLHASDHLSVQSGLVGDGADDLPGGDLVQSAHLNTIDLPGDIGLTGFV